MNEPKRRRNGQYDHGPKCQGCSKPAGYEYQSHPLTDSKGSDGVDWGAKALVLCEPCADATLEMTTVAQFEAYAKGA